MEDVRIVSLDHSELISAVQQAMAGQLRRDGRLLPGAELGLLFYASSPDDLHVVGRVRQGSQVLLELTGRKAQLSAVATQLALDRLPPAERRCLAPDARVEWRNVRFTGDGEPLDRFFADVTFRRRG